MGQVSEWVRLNVDWHESRWLAKLPWEVRAIWPILLCHVKNKGRGGVCREPIPERFCGYYDIPITAYNALLEAAVSDGALRIVEGDIEVTHWSTYQSSDPTNVERQQRHRDKKRKEKEATNAAIQPDIEPEPPNNNGADRAETEHNALRNQNVTRTVQDKTIQDKRSTRVVTESPGARASDNLENTRQPDGCAVLLPVGLEPDRIQEGRASPPEQEIRDSVLQQRFEQIKRVKVLEGAA